MRAMEGVGITDRCGVLEFRFLLNGSDRDRVRLTMSSLVSRTPAEMLPAVRLVADLPDATGLVVAVRGGRPLTSLWRSDESEVREASLVAMARWTLTLLDALLAVQADTFQCVTIPDIDESTPEQVGELIKLARLLRGEKVSTTWSKITMTRGASGDPPPTDPRALSSAQPGDSVRLVPGSSAEATIAVVPVDGAPG